MEKADVPSGKSVIFAAAIQDFSNYSKHIKNMKKHLSLLVLAFLAFTATHAQELTKQQVSTVVSTSTAARTPGVDEPLKNVPGTAQTYEKKSSGFYLNFNQVVYADAFYAGYITMDGNDVYFYAPLSEQPTKSYMKGTRQGNKIIVKLPQVLAYKLGTKDPAYLTILERVDKVTTKKDGTKDTTQWYQIKDDTPQELTYNIDDNGDIDMNLNDQPLGEKEFPKYILGLVGNLNHNDNGSWMKFGDDAQHYNLFNKQPLTPPAQAKIEDTWQLSSDRYNRYVKMAFDGDDVYLANFLDSIPDSYVKGKREGNKVTFASKQYLGLLKGTTPNEFAYFYGTDIDKNAFSGHKLADHITFTYDEEKHTMTADPETAIMVNSRNDGSILYQIVFDHPVLRYQAEDYVPKSIPAPTGVEGDYYSDPYSNIGMLMFNLPTQDAEGNMLPTKDMYYNVYFNDQLYTFEPETYTKLTEAMTDVPYGFHDDYDFGWMDGSVQLYFYDPSFKKYGVQAIFKRGDIVIKSPLVEAASTSGIHTDKVDAKQPVKIVFHDLTGREVQQAIRGLYVKTVTYSDGTQQTFKVVKR